LTTQVIYADAVAWTDWAHIKAPTLVFGGAEDVLPGSAALFKERMKFVAETIPNGNGHLHLIPGIGTCRTSKRRRRRIRRWSHFSRKVSVKS
jgi:pimeloyl-ACP methyl ester carboxylesterase